MSKFFQLYERLVGRDFWDHGSDELDERALKLVKRGMELRADRSDGKSFWDDFLLIFGANPDAVAQLLNVEPGKIGQWSSRIRRALRQLQNEKRP